MNENVSKKADWLYLPGDLSEVSLWACLHDAKLISCSSNLLERFVTLEFHVGHLRDDAKSELRFLLTLKDVSSVRAVGHFRWVGEFELPNDVTPDQRDLLVKEYWAKWREETLSWSEFEAALASDPLDVGDACYVSTNGETTLRLGGFLNGDKFDDIFFDVYLRGGELIASRSDGKNFSLVEFIQLGERYWDLFGKKEV